MTPTLGFAVPALPPKIGSAVTWVRLALLTLTTGSAVAVALASAVMRAVAVEWGARGFVQEQVERPVELNCERMAGRESR